MTKLRAYRSLMSSSACIARVRLPPKNELKLKLQEHLSALLVSAKTKALLHKSAHLLAAVRPWTFAQTCSEDSQICLLVFKPDLPRVEEVLKSITTANKTLKVLKIGGSAAALNPISLILIV